MIYWSIKTLLNGRAYSVALGDDATKMRMLLPGTFIDTNLGVAETDEVLDLHVLAGLARTT
jgi:hypothetical protein